MGLFKGRARHAPQHHPARTDQSNHAASGDHAGAPDFNTLVNLTRHDPARLADLWHAVFELPSWHFLVTDSDLALQQSRPPRILQCLIEKRPFMVAFTSEAIAASCARTNPDLFGAHNHSMIELPTPRAALFVAEHITANIFGIVFNQTPGHHGFYAPLTNILPMYNRARGMLPPGTTPELLARAFDFDPLLRRARVSAEPDIRNSILHTLASLDAWAFLTSSQAPQTPMTWEIENQPVLMAFTDDRQLARMAQLALKQNIPGPFNALHLVRADVIDLLERLLAQGTTTLVFNLAGESLLYPIDTLLDALTRPSPPPAHAHHTTDGF